MVEYRRVEFLINPLKNRVWAVSMPDGEPLTDIMSVKRASFCIETKEQYWLNSFGGAYHLTIKESQPYEEEFVKFKEQAQQYMCISGYETAHLEYIGVSPLSSELIFDEENLFKKLNKERLEEFKRFMSELWEYVKEE
ncbi:hypothetical protein IAE16_04920 [Hydrogenobacter sp. T-2]|uniref:hypothetical protein n=1 Tax=Pampinifervens diazotrophicum TaxID=1632018 RepID=UPI002B25A224|nr:hypothetical protein [Hydrogenobacter sp. T-2]WPM33024.1 hypothetical protein IAE16_04920 [Hydrogenobacter sp. T-2]